MQGEEWKKLMHGNSLHETQLYFINLETFLLRSLLTPTGYYHTFTPLKTKLRSNTNSKYHLLKSEIVKYAEFYILRSKLFTRAYIFFSMPCTRGLKPCQTHSQQTRSNNNSKAGNFIPFSFLSLLNMRCFNL